MSDLPSRDWISGDGSRALTNHAHTSVQDPHASDDDRRRYIDGWFSAEMPDLRTMSPELGTYLIQQALWWIEYADLSGLRIDTYSYSDKRFMAGYTDRIMTEYPHFNIVGEEWRVEPSLVAYWQADKVNHDGYVSHLPSLMDFPVQSAISESLLAKDTAFGGLRVLYERLGTDFLYPHPDHMVVFADNHDTDRIYATLGHDDALFRLAMTFVATTRGIPQVVYGTEVLLANEHSGKDGERRGDFPGGWAGDVADGFSGRGLDRHTREAQEFVRRLFTWRRHSPAVQHGSLRHYAPADGVYVYFREVEGETAMVVLSKATTPVKLDLARFRESLRRGSIGREVLTERTVTLDDTLVVEPRSAMVIDIR
jgi:glycosidase